MNKRLPHLLFTLAAATFFCIVSAQSLYSAQLVDRIVAIVNDDVITLSEVNEAGKGYFQKITEQAPPAQMDDALRRAREEVLGNLVDKKLIAQEADRQGVQISDAEVQAAADRMLENNQITRDVLDAQLAQMGMTYDNYVDTLRNQLLQSKLVNFEIRSKLIITDDMILDYYDTHYTTHVKDGGYYLMQMGFVWGQDASSEPTQHASKADAKKRAERVHALVVSGQDFRNLAQKFSDLPSATDGGDLGVFQEDDMAPYMQKAILPLKPGEISEIVETPTEYQFFKLLSSRDGQIVVQASFESVKNEISQKLYDQKLKERFDEWVANINENAYIKRL